MYRKGQHAQSIVKKDKLLKMFRIGLSCAISVALMWPVLIVCNINILLNLRENKKKYSRP